MNPARVRFHHLALQELWDARDWYAARSPEAAERFRIAAGDAVQRIADRAESLPVALGDFRYIKLHKFPYIIVFRARGPDTIFVTAVAHTSRRFGYWRRRR